MPVELWTSTTLPPPLLTDDSNSNNNDANTTDLAIPGPGCDIDGRVYTDGMQV